MSAGRRGLLLAIAFLGLSLWLCTEQRATAQPGRFQPIQPGIRPPDPGAGQHTIWDDELSPEDVRQLLMRFGLGEQGREDPFEEMLRRIIRDKNRDASDAQVKEAAKRLMADKEFRDRVMDLVQKHKNQQPKAGGGGPAPKLTQEDIAKLVKVKPDGVKGDPFKVPEGGFGPFDPNQLPPFDPKNPNFDPERFPKIDPKNPPKFDPKSGFPLDPKTDRPFDPRNGRPIDPENPPKIEPVPPKVNPMDPGRPPPPPPMGDPPRPPKVEPKMGQPPEPPTEDNKRKFDPENPLGVPEESPEQAAKTKAVETATALWEKNVGPIEESPGVKRAIIDLVSDQDMMDALTDDKGNNFFDFLRDGDGEGFGDWLKGGDSNWEWPKFDFSWGRGRGEDIDFGRSRDRSRDWSLRDGSRSRGSSSLDMGSFSVGSVQVPWLLLLVILALIVAAVVWWKWGALIQPRPAAVAATEGGGGWPLDPREINSREDVVKAFEYLSVLICGPGARTWTHSTIADELTELARTDPGAALKLARLYELARYAPLDEPLTRAELLEARRLVCELAGMDEV